QSRAGRHRRNALSAPAELHRSRSGPCAGERPHCKIGRERAGAGARRKRLWVARCACGRAWKGRGMASLVEQESPFLASYRSLEGGRSPEPAWLRRIRDEAINRFSELGFPTTRQEEWKYTSVAPIAKTAFHLARPEAADGKRTLGVDDLESALRIENCSHLVF